MMLFLLLNVDLSIQEGGKIIDALSLKVISAEVSQRVTISAWQTLILASPCPLAPHLLGGKVHISGYN